MYDHLAREFCVCDRWFCSVPGATWPNRLYAVAGQAAGSKDGQASSDLRPALVRAAPRDAARSRWRWYSHDVGTLRFSDAQFRVGYLDKFAYFDRRSLLAPRNFLDDAKEGKLPAVSWIDPNFVDVSFIGPSGSNDDHPPSDIKAGQELVLKSYSALVNSPKWRKTMLIVTYDEHGGFFDHVLPPAAHDDEPAFRTYGVRVPALVVSPFTERGERLERRLRPHVDHQDDPAPLLREERADPGHGRAGVEREPPRRDTESWLSRARRRRLRPSGMQSTASPPGAPTCSAAAC